MSGLRQGASVEFSERCGHTRSLTGTCGKEKHPRLGILAKSSLRLWRAESCQGKGKMKHSAKYNDSVQNLTTAQALPCGLGNQLVKEASSLPFHLIRAFYY